jgi:hypothetical protein
VYFDDELRSICRHVRDLAFVISNVEFYRGPWAVAGSGAVICDFAS